MQYLAIVRNVNGDEKQADPLVVEMLHGIVGRVEMSDVGIGLLRRKYRESAFRILLFPIDN